MEANTNLVEQIRGAERARAAADERAASVELRVTALTSALRCPLAHVDS